MVDIRRLAPWRVSRHMIGLLLVAGLGVAGCSEEVTGPEPGVENPARGQELPVNPGIICQEQHPEGGTRVEITGEKFAPVPVDLPGNPTVALPSVSLVKQTTLGGDAEAGATVPYGSEPGAANADLLSWESQSLMAFQVPNRLTLGDGTDAMVPTGMYDVQVTNPNEAQATSMGALAVAPRPTVEEVSPGLVCVAQESETVTLSAQTVLRIGENQAVVRIGGNEFSVESTEGCTPVAHDGLDAEFCDTVTVILAQGSLPAGYHLSLIHI